MERERGWGELKQLTDFGVPTNSVTNPSLETLLYFNQSRKRKKEEGRGSREKVGQPQIVRTCKDVLRGALGHTMPHTHTHTVAGNKGPKAAGKNCSVI